MQKTLEREDATRRSFSTSWTDEFIFERASVRSTRPRIIQSLSLRSNCCIGENSVLRSRIRKSGFLFVPKKPEKRSENKIEAQVDSMTSSSSPSSLSSLLFLIESNPTPTCLP